MTTAAPSISPDEHPVPAQIRVFHNNRDRREYCSGFQRGHSVTEVYTYITTRPSRDTPDRDLAAEAFYLLNVGADPGLGENDTRAIIYRALRNRSLSVSDVVAVDQRFYSFDCIGWTELTTAPPIAQHATDGTTPLY